MTGYRRFKFAEASLATVATLATVRSEPAQSVATFAYVAKGASQTTKLQIQPACLPDSNEIQADERAAIAEIDGGVPRVYADAFAGLQLQQPISVGKAAWERAVYDAGLFLDQWGSLANEFQWTPGDLFDVPHDAKPGGLIWFLQGEPVRALGHPHAITESGRSFVRETDFDVGGLRGGTIR
jgi:hypothetical protein